ncbi:MAG: hypothetical protein DMG96_18535 [Acidobacteria bacterium]|nr:MAG: hypothetical protein DMG96_18535 [Acidobacteriota bacterium]
MPDVAPRNFSSLENLYDVKPIGKFLLTLIIIKRCPLPRIIRRERVLDVKNSLDAIAVSSRVSKTGRATVVGADSLRP